MARPANSTLKGRKQKAEGSGALLGNLLPSAFCLLLLFAQAANAQIFGYLAGRSAYVTAPPSWTRGGLGRFDVGADAAGDHAVRYTAVAQIGADWSPATWLTAHAQVIARREPSGTRGRRFGLAEAYAELHSDRWRLRAGEFFLPTSRENTDPLWTSPYTVTYSALNSWMGEEVRPIGADLQFSPSFYLTLGATAFRGNDTMGTLLSARGWSLGSRLTLYDENVAVPPPDQTTKPFGPDLDGKYGYSGRVRMQLPERALLQVTHADNRAELVKRRGQTPWLTRFNVVGAQIGTTSPWTLAAEWLSGDTTVGFPGGKFTMNFDTVYLLGSYKLQRQRISARVERFSTSKRGRGRGVTVAWFREPSDRARAGIEYTRTTGDRPGSMWTAELRYKF